MELTAYYTKEEVAELVSSRDSAIRLLERQLATQKDEIRRLREQLLPSTPMFNNPHEPSFFKEQPKKTKFLCMEAKTSKSTSSCEDLIDLQINDYINGHQAWMTITLDDSARMAKGKILVSNLENYLSKMIEQIKANFIANYIENGYVDFKVKT